MNHTMAVDIMNHTTVVAVAVDIIIQTIIIQKMEVDTITPNTTDTTDVQAGAAATLYPNVFGTVFECCFPSINMQ